MCRVYKSYIYCMTMLDGEFAYEKHCQRLHKSPQRSVMLWRTQRSRMMMYFYRKWKNWPVSLIERKKERKSVCQSVGQRYYEIHIHFLQYDANLRFMLTYGSLHSRIKHARPQECRLMLQEMIMEILTCFILVLSRYHACFCGHVMCYLLLSGITCPQNLYW